MRTKADRLRRFGHSWACNKEDCEAQGMGEGLSPKTARVAAQVALATHYAEKHAGIQIPLLSSVGEPQCAKHMILIWEPWDRAVSRNIRTILEELGYEVFEVITGTEPVQEALRWLRDSDLILHLSYFSQEIPLPTEYIAHVVALLPAGIDDPRRVMCQHEVHSHTQRPLTVVVMPELNEVDPKVIEQAWELFIAEMLDKRAKQV